MSETQPTKYYKSNNITEVVYHRQASDYFERFKMELGRTIAKKTGHPVYTNFQSWCHAPTLTHPQFKIKLQMSNKAGGSVFTEITISEFDEWYQLLGKWRLKYDNEIKIALANSLELQKRSHLQHGMSTMLEDLNLPMSIVEDAIISTKTTSPGAHIDPPGDTPIQLDLDKIANDFLTYFLRWKRENDPNIKNYLYELMQSILPPDKEAIEAIRTILNDGLHPVEYYNELTNSLDHSPDYESLVEIHEITLPKTLDNQEIPDILSTTYTDSQEELECQTDAPNCENEP